MVNLLRFLGFGSGGGEEGGVVTSEGGSSINASEVGAGGERGRKYDRIDPRVAACFLGSSRDWGSSDACAVSELALLMFSFSSLDFTDGTTSPFHFVGSAFSCSLDCRPYVRKGRLRRN